MRNGPTFRIVLWASTGFLVSAGQGTLFCERQQGSCDREAVRQRIGSSRFHTATCVWPAAACRDERETRRLLSVRHVIARP
jgi:hypothetical protein